MFRNDLASHHAEDGLPRSPGGRTVDECVDHVRLLATQVAVLQAELVTEAGFLTGTALPPDVTATEWLGFVSGLNVAETRRTLRLARRLVKLPQIREAFAAGALSEGVVDQLCSVATPENEASLLDTAKVATGAQLTTLIRSFRRQRPEPTPHDEPGERPEPEDTYAGGFDDDGRYRFRGDFGPNLGARVDAALKGEIDADRRRRREQPSVDGIDGPRASEQAPLTFAGAFANIIDGYVASVAAGNRDGVVPSPFQAILHLDHDKIAAGWIDDAAYLHNGGAVDPAQARLAACDAAWRAVLTTDLDPAGVTYERRLASAAQRAACYVRDRMCRFPGCGRTAWLKVHHHRPTSQGGATRLDNLFCLCQAHHTLIHKPGWRIAGSASGDLTFIRPDGSVVRPHARLQLGDLPPPPEVDLADRYQASGEPLTHWAHDMLLADWLDHTPQPVAA